MKFQSIREKNTSQTGVEDQEIESLEFLSSLLCEFADAAERGEIEFADRDAVGDVREENGVFALQLCDESIASGGRALKRSAGHQNGTGAAPQQTLHGLVADPSRQIQIDVANMISIDTERGEEWVF